MSLRKIKQGEGGQEGLLRKGDMSRQTWVKGENELGECLRKTFPESGNCRCKGPEAAIPGAPHPLPCFFLSAEAPAPISWPLFALCSCGRYL